MSNDTDLDKCKVKGHIDNIIKRQMTIIGNLMRKVVLENFIVTGHINGKRVRGK